MEEVHAALLGFPDARAPNTSRPSRASKLSTLSWKSVHRRVSRLGDKLENVRAKEQTAHSDASESLSTRLQLLDGTATTTDLRRFRNMESQHV